MRSPRVCCTASSVLATEIVRCESGDCSLDRFVLHSPLSSRHLRPFYYSLVFFPHFLFSLRKGPFVPPPFRSMQSFVSLRAAKRTLLSYCRFLRARSSVQEYTCPSSPFSVLYIREIKLVLFQGAA